MVSAPQVASGIRKDDRVVLTQVTYSGFLNVIDADRLRQIAVAGVGPGKAYGNGLLGIAAH